MRGDLPYLGGIDTSTCLEEYDFEKVDSGRQVTMLLTDEFTTSTSRWSGLHRHALRHVADVTTGRSGVVPSNFPSVVSVHKQWLSPSPSSAPTRLFLLPATSRFTSRSFLDNKQLESLAHTINLSISQSPSQCLSPPRKSHLHCFRARPMTCLLFRALPTRAVPERDHS